MASMSSRSSRSSRSSGAGDTHTHPPATSRPSERSYLLVFHQDSSTLVHLPRAGSLTIGRGEDAAVRLDHASISRRHAAVLCADGDVAVADLGSHNGTWVNGERIDGRRALHTGDTIAIGEATLVLHRPPGTRATEEALPAARLLQRLDEEVERALDYGRSLAVVALTVDRAARERAAAAIGGALRRIDVVGLSGETQLLVITPERDRAAALAFAERLVSAAAAADPSAKAGVAVVPDDGCRAEDLLEAARAAATTAAAGAAVPSEHGVERVAVGERTVLVADPAMKRIVQLLRRLAASELPVLITGETGVGKEHVAQAVHAWSSRAARPFVVLNCAAVHETLAESELFGHERGAFSGATHAKPGLLESAAGGTVFLDEVGELTPAVQAKLLRAVEAKRITRIGSVREREVDIRIVAATNRDLEREAETGAFRRDLLFRLSAARVILPPLRERPREIPLLAREFLDEACRRANRSALALSTAAVHALTRHGWPGNVRELRNVIEYVAASVDGSVPVIEPWHFPAHVGEAAAAARATERAAPANGEAPRRAARRLADEVRDLERSRIREALERTGGVKTHAAQLIGMPLRTFLLRLKKYDLDGGR
jgi:two-component system, NtrC family, response regulator AtoC